MIKKPVTRLLLVEDNPGDARLLREMCNEEGPHNTEVMHVRCMSEAEKHLAGHTVDIILLDLGLPDAQGLEGVRRAQAAARHVPLVVLSGMDDESLGLQALQEGAEDYLIKGQIGTRGLIRALRYAVERKNMKEAFLGESERFHTLANNISQLAWMADATGYIFWYNDRWFDYTGTTFDEMAGWAWQKLTHKIHHPDHAQRVVDKITRCFETGEAWDDTFPLRGRDGTFRWFLSRAVPIRDAEGTVLRWFGTNTDVTESKIMEAELAASRDLALESARMKSEFLANMSHEIRTPMNGVIGMTDLVLDTELTVEQRENLEIVKSSADGLLTIINDILDFSRIEAGKLELHPIDFKPRETVADTATAVAWRAHQKGLELLVEVGPDVPPVLNGDPGRLRQILVNLLGNAIKFTELGEVFLRVTKESSTPLDVVLHFAITDTGVGIPLDRQKSVFEPFTQADGSTTRTFGGTGLGLTISSQLVHLMDGRVWVESEVGKGSVFHFTARFAVVNGSSLVETGPAPVDLSDVPVLVVDDNKTNRRLLEAILIGWRMAPTLVASASGALVAMRAAQESGKLFPLVLTDFQMPDADGFTLITAIKEDATIAGAAIVILTSAGQPGDAARCRELGVAAYLSKPIRPSELHGAILSALGVRPAEENRPLVTRHSLREAREIRRILLVEDNRVNQLVARRLLEKRGHSVVIANNGREALAILEESAFGGFDCVLMDIQMPEMDGLQCTAHIRARGPVTRSHLFIVAMTAHAMKEDEARCLEAGMDAYLSKPIQPADLFNLVERQHSL